MTLDNLKAKSTDELKVLAYDNVLQIGALQKTLEILNQMIAERPQEVPQTQATEVQESEAQKTPDKTPEAPKK